MKLTRFGSIGALVDGAGKALRVFDRLWDEICSAIEGAVLLDGSAVMTGPLTVVSYAVADLPAVGAGQVAYATDGRKNGEGAGSGTGVLVFSDATAWRACDTGATVAA